jgi:hypothetical protein
MKAHFVIFLMMVLSFASQAQTIFTSELNSLAEFRRWTVIDSNGDGATWQYLSTQSSGKRTFYNYHSTNNADDWLVSPEIVPEITGQYMVSFNFEIGQGLAESVKICYGSAPTADALSKNCGKAYDHVKGSFHDYFVVDLKAGEPFYVAFYACSDKDLYRIFAQSMEVTLSEKPVDLTIERFITPVSRDTLLSAEPVTLRIKNVGNHAAAAGTYTVDVSVDGKSEFTEKINTAIAAGGEADVTLAGKLDLSSPHRNYTVTATATHPADVYADNNSLTTIARHKGPADVPFSMGFEDEEDTTDICYYKDKATLGHWIISPGNWYLESARSGKNALCFTYNGLEPANEWAIIDGIKMEAGYHVFKFWISTLECKQDESVEVYWGDSKDPQAMTNLIGTYNPLTAGEYKQKMGIIHLDKAQVVYIGFRATKGTYTNWICIDDIEVDEVSEDYVDLHICSLIKPTDLQPQLSSKTIMLKVKNHGVKAATGDLRVYIDGKKYYDQPLTVELKADRYVEISGVLDKIKEGDHDLRIELVNAYDVKQSDNVIETTFRMLGTPDCLWTFEDGLIPSDFEVRSEDSLKLTDTATAMFGSTGFGIIKNEDLPSYNGQNLLGVATNCTVSGSSDRWIVLPRVHVDSGYACFVTNVGALSADCDESYRIKVSEDDDVWWDYKTLLSVDSESNIRMNRGVDLGDYYGKNIYIAINVTSLEGYGIGFDNIALYDCSYLAQQTGGLNHLTTDDTITIDRKGNTITVNSPHGAALVEVYHLDGRRVLRTSAKSFDISHLASGFYCIRALTPYGAKYIKIVK